MTGIGGIRILPLAQIGLVAAAVITIYWDSFVRMTALWATSSYRHGALVVPIVALLLWRQNSALAAKTVRPWFWGLPLLVATVLVWILSKLTGIQLLEHVMIVGMIVLAIVTFLGIAFTKSALFPLLFLFMAVPIGDELVPGLLLVTADGATLLLRLIGEPVFREGLFISLPGGTFEVVEVCSGLRYFTAGIMISLLFGYLSFQSSSKRILFVVVTGILMIGANIVRAFIVMFVASATEMRVFAGRDHVYFGWFLFAVLIIGLLAIGARFSDRMADEGESSSASTVATTFDRQLGFALMLGLVMLAITARPFDEHLDSSWLLLVPVGAALLYVLSRRRGVESIIEAKHGYRVFSLRGLYGSAIIVSGIVVLMVGPIIVYRDYTVVGDFERRISLPNVSGCQGPSDWRPAWRPQLNQPDGVWFASYECGASTVSVFIGGYADTMQGKELVGRSSQLFPASWRRYSELSREQIQIDRTLNVPVNEVYFKHPEDPAISWYWYTVGGRPTTEAIVVKMFQVWRVLAGKSREAFVCVLSASGNADVDDSREDLRRVSAALIFRNGAPLGYENKMGKRDTRN